MAKSFQLGRNERVRLREAIRNFEHQTSAELRISIVRRVKGDPVEYAKREFVRLGMTKTALRNGVLICIILNQRKVVVWGDEGIHNAVPEGTWDEIVETIVAEFREGRYYDGLANAIERLGEVFGRFFPYQSDDVNELSDEIEFSDGDAPDANRHDR